MKFIFRFNPDDGGKKFINVIQVTDPNFYFHTYANTWDYDGEQQVDGIEVCCSPEYITSSMVEQWGVRECDGDFLVEANSLEELKGMYVEYFL